MTRADGKAKPEQTNCKQGPRPMRAAIASVAACLIDLVSIGGRIPLPREAEKLARKWVYGEDSDDE